MITDQQIMYDALRRYTIARQEFAAYANKEGSVKENGEEFSEEEKADALAIAARCDRLTAGALGVLQDGEKRIITLN